MNTRHFRAPNTQLALEEVQRELGPEAIIISVKQVSPSSPWQVWKNPDVEVIAMPAPGAGVKQQERRPQANPPRAASPSDNIDAILNQLAQRVQSAGAEPLSTTVKPKVEKFKPADIIVEKTRLREPEGMAARNSAPKPASQTITSRAVEGKKKDALAEAPVEKTPTNAPEDPSLPEAVRRVQAALEVQGIDKTLVKKLVATCTDTLSPRALTEEVRVRNHVRKQLEAYVRAHKHDLPGEDRQRQTRVICIIGASGVGKTSACAKMAAYYSTVLRKKVAWICADTIRTGAIALARAYTEPLGIPLELAYTPEELAQAVKSLAGTEIILVDTPARNPRDETEVVELGAFLTALPERITYLVVPATAKEQDLNDAIAAFTPFNLRGLVITKFDETGFYGSIFNLAWRSQIPMAYFSNGPRVLQDLHPAQVKQMVGMIFGENLQRAAYQ